MIATRIKMMNNEWVRWVDCTGYEKYGNIIIYWMKLEVI